MHTNLELDCNPDTPAFCTLTNNGGIAVHNQYTGTARMQDCFGRQDYLRAGPVRK